MKEYPATIIELENGDVLATPVPYDKLTDTLRKKKKARFVKLYASYFYPESTTTINIKLSEIRNKTININKIVTIEKSLPHYVTIVHDTEEND